MNELVLGIDLGTTNSAAAVWQNNQIQVLAQEKGQIMPSYVGLTPDGTLLVGETARNQFILYPERTVRSIKRLMGQNETVQLGDKSYTPPQISAMILRELKNRAEAQLQASISKAVITVPAYFSDAQRQATRDAGAIAGFDVLRILNEPTAAALAYETHEHSQARTVLVYDLGGGTFDVSIVSIEGDLVEVIASHGDSHLGGDDFDELLEKHLLECLHEQYGDNISLDKVSHNRLLRAAETAKIRLSDEPYSQVLEDNLQTTDGKTLHLDVEISREQFDDLILPLMQTTLQSVHKALDAAKLAPRELDEIVLVGGSTRIPLVSQLLADELQQTPRHDLHPDLAVAYGAGVMAARSMGADDLRILVDITPYTFGTSAYGMLNNRMTVHLFCPVIASGTPLPVSRTESFYTMFDGQPKVEITVFEGDDPDARKNILLGKFMVEGLDPNAPAQNVILLHMELDLDGILRVTATEKHTGLSKHIQIERALDRLSPEAIARSQDEVAQLFGDDMFDSEQLDIDDDDEDEYDDEDIDVVAAPVAEDSAQQRKARVLLRRLDSKLDSMDAMDRKDATQLREQLIEAMDNDDTEQLNRLILEIDDLLFYVESGK